MKTPGNKIPPILIIFLKSIVDLIDKPEKKFYFSLYQVIERKINISVRKNNYFFRHIVKYREIQKFKKSVSNFIINYLNLIKKII